MFPPIPSWDAMPQGSRLEPTRGGDSRLHLGVGFSWSSEQTLPWLLHLRNKTKTSGEGRKQYDWVHQTRHS